MNETEEKDQVFKTAAENLYRAGFRIIKTDKTRPWGGFFVIDEKQVQGFISSYFPGLDFSDFNTFSHLSPKILVVEPQKKLSWQYHNRREEIWRVISGPVGVVTSPDNKQRDIKEINEGDIIKMQNGERHRLVGLKTWGIVAEIWQHTVPGHPSDENDIIRLEDDFGR